jgi:outer membrane protein assembly factor BamB
MKSRFFIVGILMALVFASIAVFAQSNATPAQFWGQWRGPDSTGVSKTADPPLEWSETKNVRWKIEIPGRGSGSPVVWGDRVYVLTAVPVGISGDAQHSPRGGIQPRIAHRFVIMAISRRDGKVVWERTVREEAPHEGAHVDNGTWASSSAVTDGEHLFAFFESRGLYAFTMDGEQLWTKDFGDKRMRNQFGEGSTPALHRNRLVVVWDQQGGQSFVVTLDKKTGEEIWRVNRTEIDTWATPLVVEHGGKAQVIVPGQNRLRSYDLENGEIVWESAGLTMNPIPSPVAADGMVYATSGFQGNNLKAIRIDGARGDITGSPNIVWTLDRDTPYVPSPILYDGILYILKTNNGILSAFDAKTGKPHYQGQRLAGVPNVFASPVGASGRVYFPGREGTTLVIRNSPMFEVLATNVLDDGFDASPALVEKEIYLRGHKFLYCIAGT